MRGEEVQLIGLAAQYSQEQHLVILPGTHSKHATIAHDQILHFNTFMTGEIYAVMLNHSLLGRDLPESDEDHHAFALGVQNAQNAPNLSNALFSARTLKLAGSITLLRLPVIYPVCSSALNCRHYRANRRGSWALQPLPNAIPAQRVCLASR